MKLENATIFVLAFSAFYFVLLLSEYPKYGIFWDEGGHLSNGFFVGEGIKTFINTLSVQQTFLHLKGLSAQYNIFQVLHYPPLFYTLEGVLFAIMGPGELPGKALSMLFSVGAIFVTYMLGREVYGTKAGIIGAIFLAASPLFFRSSLMAMMDTLTAFSFALSIYAFVLFLNDRISYQKLGLVFGIALWARFELTLLIPIVLIFLLVTRISNWKKVCIALLIGILMASPWYLISMGKPSSEGGIRALQYLDLIIFKFRFGGSAGFDPAYFAKMLLPSAGALTGLLWGIGLFWIVLRKHARREEILILLWPLVIYLFFSIIVTRLPRYSMSYLPAGAVLAGGFTTRLGKFPVKKFNPTSVVWVVVLISLLVSIATYEKSITYMDTQFANYQYRIPAVERAADYLGVNAAGKSVFQLSFRNEIGPAIIPFYLMTKYPNSGIRYRDLMSFQMPEKINVTRFKELFDEECPDVVILFDNKEINESVKQLDNLILEYGKVIVDKEKFVIEKKFENAAADVVIYKRNAPTCGTTQT